MKRQIVINNPLNDIWIRFRCFRQRLRYRIISLLLKDYEKEKIATAIEDTKDYYYKMWALSKDESDVELYKDKWVKVCHFKVYLKGLGVESKDTW